MGTANDAPIYNKVYEAHAFMNRRDFTSLCCSTAVAGVSSAAVRVGTVLAGPKVTGVRAVLELFTSQGCSSCPAADALFETYTNMPDVVALTMPVDYWDYLGWKDTLASTKFTKRQKHYAKTRGDGQVYTPQLVVNGVAHANGADAASIGKVLAAHGRQKPWVPIQVATEKDNIVITAAALDVPAQERRDYTVWCASVAKRVEVVVKRGENGGKTLTYFNVVRDMNTVGMWNGEPTSVRISREAIAQKGEDACAIIVQAGMAGPIVGAAMLPNL